MVFVNHGLGRDFWLILCPYTFHMEMFPFLRSKTCLEKDYTRYLYFLILYILPVSILRFYVCI